MKTLYGRIDRWFPIPKLMAMRHAGIHISSDNFLTMIELVYDHGRLIPKNHERIKMSPTEEGDDKEIIKTLTSIHSKYHLEFAKVSVPEYRSYLYEAEFPKGENGEIPLNSQDLVASTIEEKAPVSLPDVVFGYKVISETRENFAVCVGVVPSKIINESIESFSKAGIIPLTFKIEAQAVANAVIPESSRENSIIVSIKRGKTIIAIVQNGGVLMSTTVDFGGGIFDDIIKKLEGAEDNLRTIKFTKSFLNNPLFNEQMILLKNYINKYYVYWLTHKETVGEIKSVLDRIVIVGEEACMPGFLDFLSENLKVKVEAADVWVNCFNINEYVPDISREDSFAYAETIGLLIEHI